MAAQLIGEVYRVQELDEIEGKPTLVSVSVEGVSLLIKKNGSALPAKGQQITAVFSTIFPKRGSGKRPVHFVDFWQ